VNLTCAPTNTGVQITCSINPTSVDLSSASTGTASLTITTAAAHLMVPNGPHSRRVWFAASGGFLFAAVLLGGIPSRYRWAGISGLIVIALVVIAVGCGGGGSSAQQKSQGTPAGTYVVTVTGTSGSTSHSATINFKLQ